MMVLSVFGLINYEGLLPNVCWTL